LLYAFISTVFLRVKQPAELQKLHQECTTIRYFEIQNQKKITPHPPRRLDRPPKKYIFGLTPLQRKIVTQCIVCEFQVQLDVNVWFVQDQLKGDSITEVRLKFIRRLEDAVPVGED